MNKRKLFTTITLIIGITSLSLPTPSQALSCMEVSIETAQINLERNSHDFRVFEGEIISETQKGNQLMQKITVSEPIIGSVQEEIYLTYTKDETWGYMCTTPGEVGSEYVFEAYYDNGLYFPGYVYSVDNSSDRNKEIINYYRSTDEGQLGYFASIEEQRETLRNRIKALIDELGQLITALNQLM
tara:strand:- start:290 stop:844 length:555 start_codon:yes stop_codon:yes gene_type:complete